MNLHLTRDEWDRIAADGEGVLFREGELPYGDPCPCGRGEHPPAEFVEAAQPCETCGGGGELHITVALNRSERETLELFDAVPLVGRAVSKRCPDCIHGKRRTAVVVPCDQQCDVYPCKRANADCSGGVRTVGHVVVDWGPLVVIDGEFLGLGRQVWEMTPDPLPTPGQYAIGIKVVEL